MYHNNICSLSKNFHKLEEVFQDCSVLPPVIALSETKLTDASNIPSLKGYSFIHKNSTSAAGGVAFYISDTLKFNVRQDLCLSVDNCEDLWIEIFPKLKMNSEIKESIVDCCRSHI